MIDGKGLPGITLHRYQPKRGNTPGIHPLAADFETKAIRGEACADAMLQLKSQGMVPDLVVAHPGWGEALFVKEIWPSTKLLSFIELFYTTHGQDVGFDPEFNNTDFVSQARVRVKNANNLLALDTMDWGLSPTLWQRNTNPALYHERISVIFDGIDTQTVKPNPDAYITLGRAQLTLRPGDEVLTFVNRNLEPGRGYHIFMRALPGIMRRRPNARVVIVGGDSVSYGQKPPPGVTSWKQHFLDEVRGQLDMGRIHFVGRIPYPTYLSLLQVSACHVYLTYPFVLSWSCFEAMSAGGLVVASNTPPVTELVSHGENGLLVDFFDIAALTEQVVEVLANPAAYRHLRQAARSTIVSRYDLESVCLPQQLGLVEKVARL
jgi:glycosyltransferase involved in cell wall biosynthesis